MVAGIGFEGAEIDDDRVPRRKMDKQEAARHLIHFAIRQIARAEDPFAIHLVIHSAGKIVIDVAERRGISVRCDWKDHVKPEYQDAFYRRFLKTYNYLKHADRDFSEYLSVYDIAMTNVLDLFFVVVNYQDVFKEHTFHMLLFMMFIFNLMPEIIMPTNMVGVNLHNGSLGMQGMTPDLFRNLKEHPEWVPDYHSETANDLRDVIHFYHLTFRELRAGKTESPRILKFSV